MNEIEISILYHGYGEKEGKLVPKTYNMSVAYNKVSQAIQHILQHGIQQYDNIEGRTIIIPSHHVIDIRY